MVRTSPANTARDEEDLWAKGYFRNGLRAGERCPQSCRGHAKMEDRWNQHRRANGDIDGADAMAVAMPRYPLSTA